MQNAFANQHAILLARCSTEGQTELSISQQIAQMELFCAERGIHIVDVVRLEGISGLDPHARTDIDDLIKRKETRDDFGLVIVAAVDRLTRGGVKHGFKIAWELEDTGLAITSACGKYPADEDDWIKLGMAFHEANVDVRKATRRLQRGMAASILDGKNLHTHQVPYGVDRLYFMADGALLHRIRNLPTGEQVMLHPSDDQVMRSFGKIDSKKKSPHYRRQPQELITLVPGAPERVDVLRRIFRRRYVDNWRGYRIARELNTENIAAPEGGLWNAETVQNIYHNTTYSGLGIGCRRSNADIGMRSKRLEVQPPPKTNRLGRKAKRLKRKKLWNRPPEDFLPVEYPRLYDLLDLGDEVVAGIRSFQLNRYTEQGSGTARRVKGKPYDLDEYPLTGLLMLKGDGMLMTPRPSGDTKYYANSRALQTPGPHQRFASLPAALLHDAVLKAVSEVVTASESLEPTIRKALQVANEDLSKEPRCDRKQLLERQDRLLREIKTISKANVDLGEEMIRELTCDHKAEIGTIKKALATAKVTRQPLNVDAQLARVLAFLNDLQGLFANARDARGPVVGILRTLVQSITFDPDTRIVELRLYVPVRLLEDSEADLLRLASIKAASDTDTAHRHNALTISRFEWAYERGYVWRPARLNLRLSEIIGSAHAAAPVLG
jgi:hypothetical protein